MNYDSVAGPPYGDYLRRWEVIRGLKVVTPATTEQIDIHTAKAHLRLATGESPDIHPDDDLIEDIYIPWARVACENYVGRALAPQTLELSLDSFPHGRQDIELPMAAPLLGVESVTYTATDGSATTFADYLVDLYSAPARLVCQPYGWPSTPTDTPNAVVIRYRCGYETPGSSPVEPELPPTIKGALLLTVAMIYSGGGQCEEIPHGAKFLLDQYRIRFGWA